MEQQIQTRVEALQKEIAESVAAEEFFETASGKLFRTLAETAINANIAKITSGEFIKDHQGYINSLAELNAYRKILNIMTLKSSPERREHIAQEIKELTDE